MNEAVFRKVMAIIIILTVIIMVVMEIIKSENVPTHPIFAAGTGLMAGITTMLGNLAGAFSNLYSWPCDYPKIISSGLQPGYF
jgi:hypothetical protein